MYCYCVVNLIAIIIGRQILVYIYIFTEWIIGSNYGLASKIFKYQKRFFLNYLFNRYIYKYINVFIYI